MLFTITGKHIEITEAIRQHAQEKCEKLPRFYDQINHVEVLVEGGESRSTGVEVLAHIEHGEVLVAKESGHDTYACLDMAVHKLERQLKKQKEKQRDNKHLGTTEREPFQNPGQEGAA